MDLKENELHVWRYTVNEQHYLAERTDPLLSRHEQQRCDAYLNEAEKIRYTCNHRFVREVLARYLHSPAVQIEFSHARQGKPYIKNSGLFFSYSYRANLALLAVSKQEVGVDIEKMKTLHDLPTFADFSFSAKEKEMIFNNGEQERQNTLFTFWTFKEAIIKCLGVGLNADLTQIDLSDFFYSDVNPLAFNGNTYTIARMAAPEGYKAAFALEGHLNDYKELTLYED